MDRYRKYFTLSGVIVCLVCALYLLEGTAPDAVLLALGGTILLWGVGYFLLARRCRGAIPFSLAVVGLCLSPVLYQFVRRVRFMSRYGFEKPNGDGSPLAFMLGLMFELFILLPLTLALVWGIVALFERRRQADCPGLSCDTGERGL
ncbi:MAG: hypothetical protein ACYC2Y_10610 [Armatimonadota bacterium]